MRTYKSSNLRTLAAVGVFTALAYVSCVVFHFRMLFLSFDLKDSVMLIGAMLLGPHYGLAMAAIVALIEFMTISSTGIYGLIMNFVASAAFVCIGSLIYSKKRDMTGAVIGTVSSVIGMTAIMMVANIIVTPLYTNTTSADVIKMIPTVLLPFNLTKAVFNAAIMFTLYTPVSKALRLAGFTSQGEGIPAQKKSAKTTIIVTVISLVIAVASLLVFFFVLNGTFTAGKG